MTQTAHAAQFDVDITGLDALCRDILREVRERDGVATATQIKQTGAISHNELHYRLREKLTEQDLVETWTAVPEDGGQEVTHVELTPTGEQAIADGLLEAITDTHTNLATLKRDVEALQTRVEEKADESALHRSYNALDGRLERLNDALQAADPSDDIAEFEQRLDSVDGRCERLDVRLDDQVDAIGARVDDLEARQETGREQLSTEINQLRDHQEARSDALAVALNAVIAELSTLDDTAARNETLEALGTRVDNLEDCHQSRLQTLAARLDDLDARVEEQTASVTTRFETLTDRHERLAEQTQERLADLETTVERLATRVEANTRAVTQTDDYATLSKGRKRDHWRARARETIAELDCRHQSGAADQTLPDWKLLAHLDDVTLRLISEEELFDAHTVWRARRVAAIPARCRHGWKYWLLWPWYHLRA